MIGYGRRESPWWVMQRCLAIVRRLLRGPASGRELMAYVRAQVGDEAYSSDGAAARKAFQRDRARLRDEFGVAWAYDGAAGEYVLTSPGQFGLLDLSDEHLAAIKLLYSIFEEHESPIVPVKPLLDHLLSLMPADRRQRLARLADVMRVEMPELDERRIPARVWDTVERATRRRRQLAFHYHSPQQADGLPRYWVVAPVELRFRRGHWYLLCWQMYWRSHRGEGHEPAYRRFRLQYIADDERLEVLPSKVSVEHRRPPRYFVHYLLKAPVGRGDISRYFEEMRVEPRPDGSALVQGFCDDAWDAVRTLLGYGENCVVLGGEEVLQQMRRRVHGVAENYGLSGSS
jgi:predicted DNA-binding transcriptional regulator YafY